jgi:hypothetical protein
MARITQIKEKSHKLMARPLCGRAINLWENAFPIRAIREIRVPLFPLPT